MSAQSKERTIVVFSGAGLSAESGAPTFRGMGGLWESFDVTRLASPEGFAENPELVLRFYAERLTKLRTLEPHAGHGALVELESRFRVIHLTQNVDDLLERAGATDVEHIHGWITRGRCERHAAIDPFDPAADCDYELELERPIAPDDRCPRCGARVRPAVVWFGEMTRMPEGRLDELVEATRDDGIFICVGTSAVVWPAAGLVDIFADTPEKHWIDPEPQELPGFHVHKGLAGERLPGLAQQWK